MNKFTNFIKGNPKPEFHEFTMGGRFVDEDGKPLMFKIKGDLPLDIQERLEKNCQERDKHGNVTGLRKSKLAVDMIVEWSLEPNFKSAEDLAEIGAHLPSEYVQKMFTAGEQLKFMGKINELAGVGKDINEDIEEAKN